MSSHISPESINQLYPIAGQDNNSVGFRTNFTAIKNNFTYAKREIDDLMSKVVLRAPLTYGNVSILNDFGGSTLTNMVLVDEAYPYRLPTVSANAVTLDYSLGSKCYIAIDASTTVTLSNFPPTTRWGDMLLFVSVTFSGPPIVVTFTGASAPTLTEIGTIRGFNSGTKSIEFSESGNYCFSIGTGNGGTEFKIREHSTRELDQTILDLGNLTVEVGNVSSDLGNLVTVVGNLNSNLGNLTVEVGNVNSNVGNISSSLGNLTVEVGNVNSNLSNTNSNVGNVSSSLGNLVTVVDGITAQINTGVDPTNTVTIGNTASYFWNGGPAVAVTLPDGTEGQIKTLVSIGFDLYPVTVTVTNAAWYSGGLTGTISFPDSSGTSCMLQYVNGQWFVLGNYGATIL